MRLRARLLVFVTATSIGLIVGLYMLSSTLLVRNYAELERQYAVQDVERASRAFWQLADDLHVKASDWAEWDDTYRFLADRNPSYIQSNLLDDTLVKLRLDLLLYADNHGKLFYARSIRRLKDVRPPEPAAVLDLLAPRLSAAVPGDGFAGIVRQPGYPLIVSVRPILTSAGRGPARGWLVFGRYCGAGEMEDLRERTRLDVELFDLLDRHMPDDCRKARQFLSGATAAHIQPLSNTVVAGSALLKDIGNRPVVMLHIHEPRAIYEQGVRSVRYLTGLIVIAAVVFGIVLLLVLETFVLARLSNLSGQVERIGSGRSALSRVVVPGQDELSYLAGKINGMLGALEESARSIRKSEEKLRVYSENLEQTVRQRTQQLEAKNAILENAVEGIAELDAAGCYVAANIAYAGMFGYTPEEMLGQRWDRSIDSPDQECMLVAYQTMLRGGKAEVEARGVKKDGALFHMRAVLIAVCDEAGAVIGHYRFMKDISERKRLETQIEHQAFHDALTGLPNRALFMDRLALAQARAARRRNAVAVLFLDLDNFKLVNDSMGHDAGDGLLMALAERLKSCARPGDTVARLGGDEFTLLLEDLTCSEDAVRVAERIVEALRAPIELPREEVFTTGSIGIAISTDVSESPELLLRNADTAMYQAKMNGKAGYARFDQTMNDRVVERLEMETGLRRALDQGELRVYYQPLLNLETGRIYGVEALVRWQHPTQGMLSPGQFIPIAEETGLVVPLGYWVLEEACRRTKAWQTEYPSDSPLLISVNISGRQLQRDDVIERVAAALSKSELPPASLQLEITESILMSDVDDTVAKLHALKALGVKLAIDDFGTGYSSMAALSDFPIDTVKIDRAFIQGLESRPDAPAIVAAIMMLSKSMNLHVTSEGVETEEQLIHLQGLSCNTVQGFFFARPLDGGALGEYLQAGPKSFVRSQDDEWRHKIEELLGGLPALEDRPAA